MVGLSHAARERYGVRYPASPRFFFFLFLCETDLNDTHTWPLPHRENLRSGLGVKKAFYATNDVPPRHISIDLTLYSCTHKYNSIKHKILKHLLDLRRSKASHLLVPPDLHPTTGAAAHIGQEFASSHRFLLVSQGLSFDPIHFSTPRQMFELLKEFLLEMVL